MFRRLTVNFKIGSSKYFLDNQYKSKHFLIQMSQLLLPIPPEYSAGSVLFWTLMGYH